MPFQVDLKLYNALLVPLFLAQLPAFKLLGVLLF
jgi:hypothetical protein